MEFLAEEGLLLQIKTVQSSAGKFRLLDVLVRKPVGEGLFRAQLKDLRKTEFYFNTDFKIIDIFAS